MSCDRLSEAVGAIADSQTVGDLEALLARLTSEFGFSGAAYYRLTRFGAPLEPTLVFGAGFDAWVQRYVEQNYSLVDPVIPWAFRRDLPFTSREIAEAVPQPRALHEERAERWAPDGLFCPVATSWGETGVVCWASPKIVELDDRDRLAMGNLSRAFVTRYKRLAPAEPMPELSLRPLSRREVQCAYWLSEGLRAKQIADILELSVHTVRQYIDAASQKLSARNRGEMILRASALGLVAAAVRRDP